VLKALKEVGILRMKIFLIGKRVCVFTYEHVYTTKETFCCYSISAIFFVACRAGANL
jgi:hypothetical protein